MAGRGPAPAEKHTRKSNDQQNISLVSDGKLRGPVLPRTAMGKDADGKLIPWHPITVKWWNNWRKSPQSLRMMTAPDWDYLLDTARIHHEFWSSGRWELAAELRLRAAKFGATPDDRARLKIEISTGGAPNADAAAPTMGAPGNNITSISGARRRSIKEA
jgi:hypothetical protein